MEKSFPFFLQKILSDAVNTIVPRKVKLKLIVTGINISNKS